MKKLRSNEMRAVIKKRGKWYIAYIQGIPGANTQGRTRRSARRNLKEALQLILETRRYLSKYSRKNSTLA